ncbi:hypothetical protein SCE1572_44850 [Sorangium cellulosum So0157-2]|uniref:Uncharacterized protein n=1 Tax=Sorangium cellulosum So0157-2 TaxID=1254432 RepID=S4YDZ6_SORCE|nr:hypothetical protein SCE1572_44850 [Sorangium cellulosum So0157-2]
MLGARTGATLGARSGATLGMGSGGKEGLRDVGGGGGGGGSMVGSSSSQSQSSGSTRESDRRDGGPSRSSADLREIGNPAGGPIVGSWPTPGSRGGASSRRSIRRDGRVGSGAGTEYLVDATGPNGRESRGSRGDPEPELAWPRAPPPSREAAASR